MHCENVHLCLKSDDLQRRLNNSTVLNNPIDILFLAEQALRLDRKDVAFLKKRIRSTLFLLCVLPITRTQCFFLSKIVSTIQNYRMVLYFPHFNSLEPHFLPNQVPGLDCEVSFSESKNEFSFSLALHLTIDLEPQFLPK